MMVCALVGASLWRAAGPGARYVGDSNFCNQEDTAATEGSRKEKDREIMAPGAVQFRP